ncbi:MAG TPA: 5-oxoprolinase subunit PxpB [Thermodesulfobacteriota bacterium]|nr:5-oxoprolinase subunit PxpB [Thermodesulfobacteriota bacterium]
MSVPMYQPVGDHAVLVSYEERIDPEISERVRLLSEVITQQGFPWLEETVFSYRSVLIIYRPRMIRFPEVMDAIKKIEQDLHPTQSNPPDLFEIPTVYDGPYGPDLKRVAEVAGLSPREIIDLYSSTTFTIYFLGFLCAQPYLGGLPERLHIPRLDNPRIHMPAGSVGIGGIQASLLTIDQPSGHNFIGRTFLSLYDPVRMPPTPLKAGDRIIFKPIFEKDIGKIRGKQPEKKLVPPRLDALTLSSNQGRGKG